MGAPVPTTGPEAFSDPDRLAIARECCDESRALSDIAKALNRPPGSIQNKVFHMRDNELLEEGPPPREGVKAGYKLNPDRRGDYEAAQVIAASDTDGATSETDGEGTDRRPVAEGRRSDASARTLRQGQRLVILGGELPDVGEALRRLSVERRAEWVARLDGPTSRVLVAIGDDGPLADAFELGHGRGSTTQVRIDRFLDGEGLKSWVDLLIGETKR